MFPSCISFVLLMFMAAYVHSILIEKWVKPCDFKSSNFNPCVKERFQEMLGKIGPKGIQELGLASLSPLKVTFMQLAQGGNSATKIKMNFTDISIWGLDKQIVRNFQFKENNEIVIDSYVPNYKIEGIYDMSGKILTFPLTGSGRFSIDAYDVEVLNYLKNAIVKRNGKSYFITKDVSLDLKLAFEKTRIHFDNLLNNKDLSDHMNVILNENIKDVIEEILPLLRESFEVTFKTLIDNFNKVSPLEEIILNPPNAD